MTRPWSGAVESSREPADKLVVLNRIRTLFSKRERRRLAPILVALLFFLAACMISVDFFASQLKGREPASVISTSSPKSLEESEFAWNSAKSQNEEPSSLPVATARDSQETVVADNGPDGEGQIGRVDSQLPAVTPWPASNGRARRSINSEPLPEADVEDVGYIRGRKRALPEFSYEGPQEDLKISLTGSTWKGGPQVLPDPMFVNQLREKGNLDIRGGGWMVVDVVHSKITPVELFKAPPKSGASRMIEAKYVDGRDVVNPTETGFPIVRGIPGMLAGGIEVFENPACLVRYSNSMEEETCDLVLRGTRFRFKFVPPAVDPEKPTPDFIFTDVMLETGRDRWTKIISFNESFHPIGDVNRDGAPDFYVRSVTSHDESGVLTLLLSTSTSGDTAQTTYKPYNVRFKSR